MKIKSGQLFLSQKERESLRVIKDHVRSDISYDAGGTFALNPGMDEEVDVSEVKKAKLGMDVIDFILEITE